MSELIHISTRRNRVGLDSASLSNRDPMFGQLVSDLGAELSSVTSSADRAITKAKILAQSIIVIDNIFAEMDVDMQNDTRKALSILGRELRRCIADLESRVRDMRNDTIAFERKNLDCA